ncbi:TonB-dependent receptor [Prevotella herbatica]|uniref:TonB-dependent receptor n=1 Tax=Prevotella herbatica TaxID=2801997 RepID=A0ABN6EL54_9BACT|nr:TonB-dependent receptor [Prevotella herbatica]BCS86745.1 TonB-dependent receptor [Prevotella herbatica]
MKYVFTGIAIMLGLPVFGGTNDSLQADTMKLHHISDVTITARRAGTSRMSGAVNSLKINREELFKAACCNLGESFTTNPSVDVNYSDATTGAKQIKLLGLSGTYVQMMTENMPNFRGAALPYSLDYIPGTWINSIQVSKGLSSVRNGYEGITGQIDVEYLKPDADEGLTLNMYGNTLSRQEFNADANIHVNKKVSTELLVHQQKNFGHHDDNHDGFLDNPNVKQWNIQNRWKVKSDNNIFHAGIGIIKEEREGGQINHSMDLGRIYNIDMTNNRYEGYLKNAFILDKSHGTNIALMGNVSMHQSDALYGDKNYTVNQKNAFAQIMFETNFTPSHNLSVGLSLNHDYLSQRLTNVGFNAQNEKETTPGVYAQYTYSLSTKLVAMAGIRADHSSMFGTFITPRFHLRFAPNDVVSFRLSAGKGYRTVHALAENNYLLASGRQLVIGDLGQESAWNYSASSSFNIPLLGKNLKLNAEYYYTRFGNQAVIDYDSNPTQIRIENLSGKSYSNTFQIDASYPLFTGLELTAAYRINDVKTTYNNTLMEKLLTSKYKGLLTASYKTPLGIWQFDATLQLNGGGRMPKPYQLSNGNMSWEERFHPYEQLSAQVTRWFRHFSVYIGGENLTGFRQKQTIIDAENPWSKTFDPTMVWGPSHGAVGYLGIRVNIGRL